MSEIPLVIYHANCYDGFTAAWIAKSFLDECKLYPAKYGEPPPPVKDRSVYVVDFSYPRDVMVKMREEAAFLRVLDHHKTAQEDCKGLDFCTFDMEKSGCRLTWDYFFPGEYVPDWIRRIEDRDLWRFHYQDTKRVHAYVASLPMVMHLWDDLSTMSLAKMVIAGEHILRYIDNYIGKVCLERRLVRIDNATVVTLNVPRENASEIGHHLLLICPQSTFSMTYHQTASNRWRYELRARKHGDFDVSAVAKKYEGGGHKLAAGFETAVLLEELH